MGTRNDLYGNIWYCNVWTEKNDGSPLDLLLNIFGSSYQLRKKQWPENLREIKRLHDEELPGFIRDNLEDGDGLSNPLDLSREERDHNSFWLKSPEVEFYFSYEDGKGKMVYLREFLEKTLEDEPGANNYEMEPIRDFPYTNVKFSRKDKFCPVDDEYVDDLLLTFSDENDILYARDPEIFVEDDL